MREKYAKNPSLFYSMSIAATWAGAGSFIVGTDVAKTAGLIPWLLWALGNTLTCIVFGVIATKFKSVRIIALSKPVQMLMGFMCIFQIWVNMGGIYEMMGSTFLGSTVGYILVYAVSIGFVILYMKQATYRNVMTDNGSWALVYGLIFALIAISVLINGVHPIPLGTNSEAIRSKAWIMVTLMFGGFFYPTFWELLDYNDAGEEAQRVDMKTAFIRGGLLFGVYLLFVLVGAMTEYAPSLNFLKAILVSLVAVSSLSSFIYGAMINFGKKGGLIIDIAAIASWKLLVPMGVMGVWTLMQNVRIWMVFGMFIAAAIYSYVKDRR